MASVFKTKSAIEACAENTCGNTHTGLVWNGFTAAWRAQEVPVESMGLVRVLRASMGGTTCNAYFGVNLAITVCDNGKRSARKIEGLKDGILKCEKRGGS